MMIKFSSDSSSRRRRPRNFGEKDIEANDFLEDKSSLKSHGHWNADKGGKHCMPKKRMICLLFRRTSNRLARRLSNVSRFLLVSLASVSGFLWLGQETLFGDGYSPEGGMLGKTWDELAILFRKQRNSGLHKKISLLNISYPLVTPRNGRDQVSSFSRFLQVILGLEQLKKAVKLPTSRLQEIQQQYLYFSFFNDHPVLDSSQSFSSLGILKKNNCKPGWACHRCTMLCTDDPKSCCEGYCPSCYFDLLCSRIHFSRYIFSQRNEATRLIQQSRKIMLIPETRETIPRIVLQSGPKEWLDPFRFPHIVRFQNSWRQQQHASFAAAGTRYRYFTPETASRFVRLHFPRLEASFHSLSQADKDTVFGWMVLYQMGGVFATMNLLLETNLASALFDTGHTFVAAVISPLSDTRCIFLWDGFVASVPRHPVLGLAIELFLEAKQSLSLGTVGVVMLWETATNACSDRWNGRASVPCWRRTEFANHFSSFVLGKAFQDIQALNGNAIPVDDDLAVFDWSRDSENLLFLMTPDDTGATRITDPKRNLLVASTGLMGLSFEPVSPS